MLRIFRHYVPAALFVLIALDVSVVLMAVRFSSWLGPWAGEGSGWPRTAILTLLVVFALDLADLYDPRLQPGRGELAARLLLAVVPAALLAAALAFAMPAFRFGRFAFLLICGLLIPGLFLSRTAWARIHGTDPLRERLLVMGVSRAAEGILELQSTGSRPFTVL